MKLPPFFLAARHYWSHLTAQDPARQQVGFEAIAVVEKQYQLTDQFNLHQQIALLEGKLGSVQTELCHERNLAIRRVRETNELKKQLQRIAQLEHDLAQRERQEQDRLKQWLALADEPGLFASQSLPKLRACLGERLHRVALRTKTG